ncbi:MAG: hypothetical protein R3A52_32085 [Polyangiales bacterium]
MRLSDVPIEWTLVALAAACVFALVQSIRLALARWAPRRRIAAARASGADGERRAEPLLQRSGYAVIGRQVATTYEVLVDGEPCAVALRADFVVEAEGRRFVAEVKTGRLAPKVESSATRRQLLEYRLAFDVDGVLLVDVDAGRVMAMEFPEVGATSRASGGGWAAWLALGAVLGAAATAAVSSARPAPLDAPARGSAATR